jgi:hypothetical protein
MLLSAYAPRVGRENKNVLIPRSLGLELFFGAWGRDGRLSDIFRVGVLGRSSAICCSFCSNVGYVLDRLRLYSVASPFAIVIYILQGLGRLCLLPFANGNTFWELHLSGYSRLLFVFCFGLKRGDGGMDVGEDIYEDVIPILASYFAILHTCF